MQSWRHNWHLLGILNFLLVRTFSAVSQKTRRDILILKSDLNSAQQDATNGVRLFVISSKQKILTITEIRRQMIDFVE